ncbi:hypothetical protein OY671_011836, partial [Metschnikowia pulcherrima]
RGGGRGAGRALPTDRHRHAAAGRTSVARPPAACPFSARAQFPGRARNAVSRASAFCRGGSKGFAGARSRGPCAARGPAFRRDGPGQGHGLCHRVCAAAGAAGRHRRAFPRPADRAGRPSPPTSRHRPEQGRTRGGAVAADRAGGGFPPARVPFRRAG